MNFRNLLILSGFLFFIGCAYNPTYIYNEGIIYGTFYNIVYENPKGENLKPGIEKVLDDFGNSLSTFVDTSVISKINHNIPVEPDQYFLDVFQKAMEISEITNGAFDITVAPMVNAWGFGFEDRGNITDQLIDSLKQIVGYQKIRLENNRIVKENPNIMLDCSAIAKGYSCDIIAKYLEEQRCRNFMVDIGGEVVVKGVNERGFTWSIGISEPSDGFMNSEEEIQAVVELKDNAIATSGNYRNFYVEDGEKYAHTIDPKTGYPVQHSLLSATVVAQDCMTADAYATAFMVMGLEEGVKLSKEIPGIEVYFIYAEEDGFNKVYYSEGFSDLIRR